MTKEEIIEKARTILAEEFEIDVDSLDFVDVVVLAQQNFGVTLTGPDFVDVKTFSDFYELLEKKINA